MWHKIDAQLAFFLNEDEPHAAALGALPRDPSQAIGLPLVGVETWMLAMIFLVGGLAGVFCFQSVSPVSRPGLTGWGHTAGAVDGTPQVTPCVQIHPPFVRATSFLIIARKKKSHAQTLAEGFILQSDSELLIFIFRSDKKKGLLGHSDFAKSDGTKSDLRTRWPKSSDFAPESDDSTHRIIDSKNGIAL